MRLVIAALSLILMSISSWAGIFRDDFEDGNLDGWAVSGGGEWSIQDGKLSGRFAGDFAASIIHLEPSSWRDYTLEAKVCLLEKLGGHPEMAFSSRVDPVIWHGYGFCLHFVNNHAEIYRHRGLGGAAIQRLSSKPYLLSENTWYKVKCSVSGNHLSFYIDDELCAEVDDSGLESGTVAIYISSVHVLIDDIVITGDDIPNVGLGGHAVEPRTKLTAIWGRLKG